MMTLSKHPALIIAIAATLSLSSRSVAASLASCTVSVAQSGGDEVEVIKTPNLPPYGSFRTLTCDFASADGKMKLETGVLRGMLSVVLSYEGKKITLASVSLAPNTRVDLLSGGALPSGEEVTVQCSALVNPRDATHVPKCR